MNNLMNLLGLHSDDLNSLDDSFNNNLGVSFSLVNLLLDDDGNLLGFDNNLL